MNLLIWKMGIGATDMKSKCRSFMLWKSLALWVWNVLYDLTVEWEVLGLIDL
jgi:hypothetical protein